MSGFNFNDLFFTLSFLNTGNKLLKVLGRAWRRLLYES